LFFPVHIGEVAQVCIEKFWRNDVGPADWKDNCQRYPDEQCVNERAVWAGCADGKEDPEKREEKDEKKHDKPVK
jgi:hypothetical protein